MHVPIGVATRAKRLGKRKGYPDLTVVTNTGVVLYIEMKKAKGGVVSKEQKEWIEAFNTCENVKAWVCKGFKEAEYFINLNISK
jgi:hypothetical protein